MDKGITKEQSTMFQGLAVIMMLFHHFFTKPENLTLIHFYNADFCMRFAWLCKLCVVVFAFISGYGMYQSQANNKCQLKKLYKKAALRILRLYISLWLIIAVSRLIDTIVLHQPLNIRELIMNSLGLQYTYNGSWWYVLFYVIICLLFPVFALFLSKDYTAKTKIIILASVTVIIFALCIAGQHIYYPYLYTALLYIYVTLHLPIIAAFLIGILTSRYCLLDLCLGKLSDNKIILLPSAGIIFVIALIRWQLADGPVYCTWDFIMVFPFILAVIIITNHMAFLKKIFVIFGKHSTAMWLSHVLIMSYTYDFIARRTLFVVPFFIAELLLCYVISLLLDLILAYPLKLIFKK